MKFSIIFFCIHLGPKSWQTLQWPIWRSFDLQIHIYCIKKSHQCWFIQIFLCKTIQLSQSTFVCINVYYFINIQIQKKYVTCRSISWKYGFRSYWTWIAVEDIEYIQRFMDKKPGPTNRTEYGPYKYLKFRTRTEY